MSQGKEFIKESSGRPSLLQRLANLNAEKVGRHSVTAWVTFRWGVERRFGSTYPSWVDAISTSMTPNEKQVLFHLARRLPPGGTAAEIGSYHGASSCCLAAGIRSRGGKVWCIDTWMNDAVSDGHADVFPLWQRHTALLADAIQTARGYSHEVAGRIPDELALLFVDGDHSYEGVKRDLLLYLPKLRKDGILVMHDWSHDAVRRAVRELVHPHECARLVLLPNLYCCRVRSRP